jgi:hypothetical protein
VIKNNIIKLHSSINMSTQNDKFINLIFKEAKKSRFDGNKIRNDLGNWPEPDKLPQIKGRLDRPGQLSSKLFIEYILIANTIDEIDLVSLELANNFYSSHIIPLANYYDKYA